MWEIDRRSGAFAAIVAAPAEPKGTSKQSFERSTFIPDLLERITSNPGLRVHQTMVSTTLSYQRASNPAEVEGRPYAPRKEPETLKSDMSAIRRCMWLDEDVADTLGVGSCSRPRFTQMTIVRGRITPEAGS
jgi:hypothetical protein